MIEKYAMIRKVTMIGIVACMIAIFIICGQFENEILTFTQSCIRMAIIGTAGTILFGIAMLMDKRINNISKWWH